MIEYTYLNLKREINTTASQELYTVALEEQALRSCVPSLPCSLHIPLLCQPAECSAKRVCCDCTVEMLDNFAFSETFAQISWCSPDTEKYVKPLGNSRKISDLART